MGSTQDARSQYREHIAGFYTSGPNYGKPYLRNGWRWPRVRYAAGGSQYPKGYVDLRVHPAAVGWHQALAAIYLHHGYLFLEQAGGTVSMRNITGASAARIAEQVRRQYPLATSLHGHGLPIDINPSKNPYGSSRPDELDQPRWQRMIQDAKNIRTIDGILTTKWGGDWRVDDDMHTEPTLCTRAQLERGIRFETVPGWDAYRAWANNPTEPPRPPEEDGMSIKRGDPASKGCAEMQKALRVFFRQDNGTWDPWPGTSHYDGVAFQTGEDGDPGATFEANVKNAQGIMGIPKTGVADGFTSAFILAGYGTTTGGGGVTAGQVDQKISAHNVDIKSHRHRHDEGVTGLPTA